MPTPPKPSAGPQRGAAPAVSQPGPQSLPKMMFAKNQARSAEYGIPQPGFTKADLDRQLDASAERTKLRERDFFSIPAVDNRGELALKSLPYARNDTKQYIEGSQEFGNFLFGAEAAAAGVSENEALGWARFAQPVQDVLKGRWPTWKDHKGDPEQIKRGYRYFHERGPR